MEKRKCDDKKEKFDCFHNYCVCNQFSHRGSSNVPDPVRMATFTSPLFATPNATAPVFVAPVFGFRCDRSTIIFPLFARSCHPFCWYVKTRLGSTQISSI